MQVSVHKAALGNGNPPIAPPSRPLLGHMATEKGAALGNGNPPRFSISDRLLYVLATNLLTKDVDTPMLGLHSGRLPVHKRPCR
jgi:hypothetical protein